MMNAEVRLAFFPEILTDWVDSIPDTETVPVKLVDGDSTKQYENDPDLKRLLEEEGWVLNPDSKNIDEPLAEY